MLHAFVAFSNVFGKLYLLLFIITLLYFVVVSATRLLFCGQPILSGFVTLESG